MSKECFYEVYNDLLRRCATGLVAETSKRWVQITHGLKKLKEPQPGNFAQLCERANLLLSETQEFAGLIEQFLKDSSNDNFVSIEKKIAGISKAFSNLKANF